LTRAQTKRTIEAQATRLSTDWLGATRAQDQLTRCVDLTPGAFVVVGSAVGGVGAVAAIEDVVAVLAVEVVVAGVPDHEVVSSVARQEVVARASE
jgi:hypothetical protein